MMQDILAFGDAGADHHALTGGKAANLARLTAGGFAVPPGFTVTTAAYRSFLADAGLQDTIRATLDSLDFADAAALDQGAAAIRAMIVHADMPHALATAITQSYAELGATPYVAVRSSGSAEDLAEASFAGLHDTYLDIQGAADVLDAVRRCWASMWTARALSYRQDQALRPPAGRDRRGNTDHGGIPGVGRDVHCQPYEHRQ